MWALILLAALFLIFLTVMVLRVNRRKNLPHDTYVCDVCGEKDCICRKVEER